MNPALSLLIGLLCAGLGGELFVRGLVGLARWARISAAIIGTTIAAFATSSPEISVAIGAASSRRPEISLGDALGSNVVNVALILAIALCMSSIQSPRGSLKRDFPVAVLVPVLVGVLGVDGQISRFDGIVLLGAFLVWLGFVLRQARMERTSAPPSAERIKLGQAAVHAFVGMSFLAGSGHFIVAGARGIATAFGVPEFVIGAAIVAVGTSIPELATAIMSKIRGHDEIGLGTILGSNIFNGLFIVGLAATICPINVDRKGVVTTLGFGLFTTLIPFPNRTGFIGRSRGVILLAMYALYVILILRK